MAEKYAFDMGALATAMEASIVKGLVDNLSKDAAPEQRRMIKGVIDVFTRHGIRASEAMLIMIEVAEVMTHE